MENLIFKFSFPILLWPKEEYSWNCRFSIAFSRSARETFSNSVILFCSFSAILWISFPKRFQIENHKNGSQENGFQISMSIRLREEKKVWKNKRIKVYPCGMTGNRGIKVIIANASGLSRSKHCFNILASGMFKHTEYSEILQKLKFNVNYWEFMKWENNHSKQFSFQTIKNRTMTFHCFLQSFLEG